MRTMKQPVRQLMAQHNPLLISPNLDRLPQLCKLLLDLPLNVLRSLNPNYLCSHRLKNLHKRPANRPPKQPLCLPLTKLSNPPPQLRSNQLQLILRLLHRSYMLQSIASTMISSTILTPCFAFVKSGKIVLRRFSIVYRLPPLPHLSSIVHFLPYVLSSRKGE